MSGLIQDLIDERLNRSLKTSCGSPFQDVHLSNKAKTVMGMPLVFHVLFLTQPLFLFFFFPNPSFYLHFQCRCASSQTSISCWSGLPSEMELVFNVMWTGEGDRLVCLWAFLRPKGRCYSWPCGSISHTCHLGVFFLRPPSINGPWRFFWKIVFLGV